MFFGFVQLDGTLVIPFLAVNSSKSPVALDDLPLYRVYGPDGLVTGEVGTATSLSTGTITGATNAAPIVIASAAHGLATGMRITVSGVGGNTAANGTFTITVVDDDHFSLDSSTGNSAYTSGGAWTVTGLYTLTLQVLGASGYEINTTYSVLVEGAYASGTPWGELINFCVG